MKRSLVLAVTTLLLASGCTSSTGSQLSPKPDLAIAILKGSGDARALAREFGVPEAQIIEVPPADFRDYVADIPEGVTVLGVDESFGVGGVHYGNDYSCVVANNSWYTVNRVGAPTGMDAVTNAAFAPQVTLATPEVSPESAWWLIGMPESAKLLGALDKNGAKLGADDGPVVVASALLPWRTVNNSETESQWFTLEGTCVERPVLAVGGDADFLEYLRTAGPILAQAGIAYPLSGGVPDSVTAIAPQPATSVQVSGNAAAGFRDVLKVWEQISPASAG